MNIEGKKVLLGLSLSELTDVALSLGMPKFAGKQLADWLYVKQVVSIDEMTNISKTNRERLSEVYSVGRVKPTTNHTSIDGTRKYLFYVASGGLVESVYIPD